MKGAAAVGLVLGVLAAEAGAQIAPVADAVHHGLLAIGRAGGRFDTSTGSATLSVPRWRLLLDATESNGIYPDQEPIIVQLGDFNQYPLDAGLLRAARNGKAFSYRAPKNAPPRAIKQLKLKRLPDGAYAMKLVMRGLELSRLVIEDPVCLGMAVIIGDDDFFDGVSLTRKSFRAKRVKVAGRCDPGDWPWL